MRAQGLLRHIFHGTEICAVVRLVFEDEESAERIEPLLPGWTRQGKAIGAALTREQLNAFKERLPGWDIQIEECGYRHCKHKCRNAEIDSMAHSTDFGPTFTVEIPAPESKDQTRFAFA